VGEKEWRPSRWTFLFFLFIARPLIPLYFVAWHKKRNQKEKCLCAGRVSVTASRRHQA
jgi:hypothetical protein